MSKENRAERLQREAFEAHKRGRGALDRGDLRAAMAEDDDSADKALVAMMQRLHDQHQRG